MKFISDLKEVGVFFHHKINHFQKKDYEKSLKTPRREVALKGIVKMTPLLSYAMMSHEFQNDYENAK